MRFEPPFCPNPACASRAREGSFRYRRIGTYHRSTDGRKVQRFLCRACGRSFSTQTFRLDYRFKLPHHDVLVFKALVSKVTQRQAARMLGIDRKSIHRRIRRWGPAMRALHEAGLDSVASRGGLNGAFCLDELETFERNRRLMPVTVPFLVDANRFFVVGVEADTLPARGNLRARDRERKLHLERKFGRRRNHSRRAVSAVLRAWAEAHSHELTPRLISDKKSSYGRIYLEAFEGRRREHVRVASYATRNRSNPLFPVNHTLAMARDQVSRLVRRSWGASKCRHRLRDHLWIWVAWRNYVRRLTNRTPGVTPGSAVGVARRMATINELLKWRWPKRTLPAFLVPSRHTKWGQFPGRGVGGPHSSVSPPT